jgi:hypothetical protein
MVCTLAVGALVGCGSGGTARKDGAAGSGGTAGSTAGTTGTAGSTAGTTGTAGSTATAGTTGSAGTTGTAGSTDTAGTTGAAGSTVVDNVPIETLPVAITAHWFPGGWDGDAYTKTKFGPGSPWTLTDESGAATGPCSKRVAGALGACFKITYTPLKNPDNVTPTYASISYLSDASPGVSNYDQMKAPRVAQGAKRIAGQVAGAAGGEAVLFNLGGGSPDPAFYQFTNLALTTAWQKIEITLDGVAYDHFLSPFGFSSMSTTPLTFYVDDLRFDTTAVVTQ